MSAVSSFPCAVFSGGDDEFAGVIDETRIGFKAFDELLVEGKSPPCGEYS